MTTARKVRRCSEDADARFCTFTLAETETRRAE
jgi:hypothetical protein